MENLTERTQVLYQEHDPYKDDVTYIVIDSHSSPPYVVETYTYRNGEIDCIKSTSPKSLLIVDTKTARNLFNFKKERLDRNELEYELERAERQLTQEKRERKKFSYLALASALPSLYFLLEEFYTSVVNNQPVDFQRPVDIAIGTALGVVLGFSLHLHNTADKNIRECKKKLKSLEGQLLENALEERLD